MGYKNSGGPRVLTDETFTGLYTSGEDFIQWMTQKLRVAGWTITKQMAHVKFTAFAITPGNSITIAGHLFTFVAGASAPFAVHTGATNEESITNLGIRAAIDIEWTDYTITPGATPSIEWNVPEDPGDDTYDGNILAMSSAPGGIIGLWDYNPENIVGHGRSWGGGFILQSGLYLGSRLVLTIKTVNTRVHDIIIATQNGIASFTGIQVADHWWMLACPYQFTLYVEGNYNAGYFFLASHLRPYGTLVNANFVCGPINAVIPSGASRSSLSAIAARYYVDAGSPYAQGALADTNKNPALVFPGYGVGLTVLQKLTNNIDGLDIYRDNGKGIPWDAMIAACLSDPALGGVGTDTIYIIGWLWDAVIYSVLGAKDSIDDINGKEALVLLTQPGSNNNSRGTLLIQSEN